MDADTIFPALTNGEQIVGKYRNNPWCNGIKLIAILTNYRLFIRLQKTAFCCCHRSSYTAISLESIHRIDEYHVHPNRILYSILWIFWLLVAGIGIFLSINFAENGTIKPIGIIVSIIPLAIMSIIIFACLCCCFKSKSIELHGTFGSIKLLFEKQHARSFEAHLSEEISQAKVRLQQTPIPTVYPSNYYHRNEIPTMKKPISMSNRF